jgi:GTP cyclohydrolase I
MQEEIDLRLPSYDLPDVDKLDDSELALELLARLPGWNQVEEHHRAETPARLVAMLTEMMMPTDFDEKFKVFPNNGCDEMIVLAPIPFYTLCAHHVVPFYGNAYVGYVPNKTIAGLSKFPRVV